MRVVSAFRPFAPESIAHLRLGAFDWPAALQMSQQCVEAVYGRGNWFAITDRDTELPVPALRYHTTHRRLMLWIVEVCLRYLESDDFDQDTLMLSPDVLLFHDVSKFFRADLGVVVRLNPKYQAAGRPILNSCQMWGHAGKARLVAFYRRALAIAEGLCEDSIRWGADTEPLVEMLSPVTKEGMHQRSGLSVSFIDEHRVMEPLTRVEMVQLASGDFQRTSPLAMTDFKYGRKHSMSAYFDATIGKRVAA